MHGGPRAYWRTYTYTHCSQEGMRIGVDRVPYFLRAAGALDLLWEIPQFLKANIQFRFLYTVVAKQKCHC